jgi:PAS domain S-box-containing protein
MVLSHTFGREESQRLHSLEQYRTLLQVPGAAPDPALEDIVRLAADLCDTPIAGIALIGADYVEFVVRTGLASQHLRRGETPWEMASLQAGVYEVRDARYDPQFRPDGILLAGKAYRFFAATPLLNPHGVGIGCLFVQAAAPRSLTAKQRAALPTLASQVITRCELNLRLRDRGTDERDWLRVESALTVERNFVSTVLDTVGALVAVFDTEGRIVRFNRTCEIVSGYEFSTLVGEFFWDRLIPEEEIEDAIDEFERIHDGDFPATFENNWRQADGTLRRIAWSATALLDELGRTNFIIATGIDITEQREAELTLRESEARYRQLVEGSLGIICTHALDGTILSVNVHGAESLGRSVDEMVGAPLTSFMLPGNTAKFTRYLHEISTRGEAQGRIQLAARIPGKESPDLRTIAFRNKLIHIGDAFEPYILAFGVDISEQVRAEDKLRALIRQSNSVLESVGDGIYGVDLNGNVTVVNPAASQMLGYKPDELLGRNFHQLIHHSYPDGRPYPSSECPVENTIHSGDTVRVSKEVFWRKDGTSFPVEYVARPQIDSKHDGTPDIGSSRVPGKPVGVVVAFRDTTERHALDRMKDEFISTVSHELRTPLTSLRASLGLLTGGALDEKPERKAQMLSVAAANTDRLIKLVNDFLDIERISAGTSDLHSTIVSAQDLFDGAVALERDAATKIDLKFDLQPNGVAVYADPERIVQALAKLISNAIKFSPPGGTIFLAAHGVEPGEARFTIHDQGRGIPPDKLETIFERFQQADASDSRVTGGAGLGLAICRSIVTQHGGRLWASSPPGHGAFFYFTLPTQPTGNLR